MTAQRDTQKIFDELSQLREDLEYLKNTTELLLRAPAGNRALSFQIILIALSMQGEACHIITLPALHEWLEMRICGVDVEEARCGNKSS